MVLLPPQGRQAGEGLVLPPPSHPPPPGATSPRQETPLPSLYHLGGRQGARATNKQAHLAGRKRNPLPCPPEPELWGAMGLHSSIRKWCSPGLHRGLVTAARARPASPRPWVRGGRSAPKEASPPPPSAAVLGRRGQGAGGQGSGEPLVFLTTSREVSQASLLRAGGFGQRRDALATLRPHLSLKEE